MSEYTLLTENCGLYLGANVSRDKIEMKSHAVTFNAITRYDRMDVEHFVIFEVGKDCELKEFVEKEKKLPFTRGCAFFEFVHDVESISEDKEVVLMNKVNCHIGVNILIVNW